MAGSDSEDNSYDAAAGSEDMADDDDSGGSGDSDAEAEPKVGVTAAESLHCCTDTFCRMRPLACQFQQCSCILCSAAWMTISSAFDQQLGQGKSMSWPRKLPITSVWVLQAASAEPKKKKKKRPVEDVSSPGASSPAAPKAKKPKKAPKEKASDSNGKKKRAKKDKNAPKRVCHTCKLPSSAPVDEAVAKGLCWLVPR